MNIENPHQATLRESYKAHAQVLPIALHLYILCMVILIFRISYMFITGNTEFVVDAMALSPPWVFFWVVPMACMLFISLKGDKIKESEDRLIKKRLQKLSNEKFK